MNPITATLNLSMQVVQKVLVATVGPALRQIVADEAGRYLSDIEWRYKQARDLLNEVSGAPGHVWAGRQVTAEDFNTLDHHLTGYTISNNTNASGGVAAGSVRWQSLHVVYAGVDYACTDGASLMMYNSFVFSTVTGNTFAMTSSNTKPTLLPADILLIINNGGIATIAAGDSAQSLPAAVANGSVDNASLADGAVSGAKIAALGIGSGKLATGAIDAATQFTAGVIGAAALGANVVDSTKLATAVNTSISTAQTTATTGVNNAATAQTQANLGVTNAGTAMTNAGTALTNASAASTAAATADGKAVTADGKAVAAQGTANTAITNAATAQTQANLGVTNAGTALTNAATAQAAATAPITASRLNILSHVLY